MRAIQSNRVTDDIRDLNLLKQNLLLELDNYENKNQPVKSEDLTTTQKIEEAAIPVRSQCNCYVEQSFLTFWGLGFGRLEKNL